MLIRSALALAVLLVVSACDTTVPPSDEGGFGSSFLSFFLQDSVGVTRAVASTTYRPLAPGDSITGAFGLFSRREVGTEADYEGRLTAVCTDDGRATYTLASDAGPVWRLATQCEPYTEAGTWLRLEAGEAVEGGAFETAIAVP